MKNSLLVHKHLIIRAEAVKPPTDEEQLTNWLKEFIEIWGKAQDVESWLYENEVKDAR